MPDFGNKQLFHRIVISRSLITRQQLYAAVTTTQTPKNIRQRPEIMSKENKEKKQKKEKKEKKDSESPTGSPSKEKKEKKEKKRKEPEPATIENTKEEDTKKVRSIRCFMSRSSTSFLSLLTRE
jgi:hypothetical protein